MMSARVVHAGDGYAYLLRSVASADREIDSRTRLGDYYAAHGTPPGRWFGSGLDGLGPTTATAGSVVSEEQMAALYGEGLHPDADARITAGETIKAVQLGRKYPLYTGGNEMLTELAAAEREFTTSHGRRPTGAERSEIALAVGRRHYGAATGYDNAGARDIIAWVNRSKQRTRQATAGFDLTFSPAKSISVLWALGDDATRRAIERIHHRCVTDTLSWIEEAVLRTRATHDGVTAQARTKGMIAALFVHYDTRTGDPDLHTHCLVSNKVQGPDGCWRSIDGAVLLRHATTAAARYNASMVHHLSAELGVSFSARSRGEGKQAVYEIDGIDERLVAGFSTRRADAQERFDELVGNYRARHRRSPTRRDVYDLWQQAVLDTRPDKAEGCSLASLRQRWHGEAAGVLGGADAVSGMLDGVVRDDCRLWFPDDSQAVWACAEEAVAAVVSRRADFGRRHLDTAASQVLNAYRFADDAHRRAVHAAVIDVAVGQLCVDLSPTPIAVPQALRSETGAAFDRTGEPVLTTRAVLAAENRVLGSCTEPTAHLATRAEVEFMLASHARHEGFALNAGQRQLVHHLACSGMLTAAGVGPAGTGKTASMAVLSKLWRARGSRVVALAPSAAAAAGLGEEIGADSYTLAALTYRWRGLLEGCPARDATRLPVDLRPGDMLLVDEAGMASTQDLAAIVEIAEATGAVVRMIGDPRQLDAVETGGLFSTVCKRTGAPELDQVMRVGDDHAQADAGLRLRHGDETGLDLFAERGWIRGGGREEMISAAVADYLGDVAAGRDSLVIAGRNADVAAANEMIQQARIHAGDVDAGGPGRALATGCAWPGDVILTRRNARLDGQADGLRVLNGQRFRFVCLTDGGGIRARDLDSGRTVELPADYVDAHVQLGYASTIHRAQGATVDVTRAVIDSSVDRRGLYVAATRGKKENRLYAVTEVAADPGVEEGHLHMSGDEEVTARGVLAAAVAREDAQVSATDLAQRLQDEEHSPARVRMLYRTAARALAHQHATAAVEDLVAALPDDAADSLDEAGRRRVHAAVVAVAATGVDVRDHLGSVCRMTGSEDDVAAVVAHRISALAGRGRDVLAPRTVGEDPDLRLFAWQMRERLAATSQVDGGDGAVTVTKPAEAATTGGATADDGAGRAPAAVDIDAILARGLSSSGMRAAAARAAVADDEPAGDAAAAAAEPPGSTARHAPEAGR